MEGKWILESDENMFLICPLWVEDKIFLNSGLAITEDGLRGGGDDWRPGMASL